MRRWSTLYERERLNQLVCTLSSYEVGVSFSSNIMMDCLLDNDMTVNSLLSSSSLSSSSSTFSFPDDMLDDLADMQNADDDPMLEQLIQVTKQLNRQINDAIQDDAINWGNVPTIEDLSDSDCVSNCLMWKSSLQILADKMWPKFSAILGDDKNRIKCKNRYTIHYESGLIILLYRYSLPCRLHPDMEKIFGIQKSCLSAIIQSFSEALCQISIPYMTDPTIWHKRMPYYSQLISNKTRGIATNIWGFIDGTVRKTCRPIYHQRLVYTRFKNATV